MDAWMMRLEAIELEGPLGPLRIAYADWGAEGAARAVVCVHGLTRNGRDFDRLAAALCTKARVLCPDVPGRGRSDWLGSVEHYAAATYAALLAQLLERLGIGPVDWIGTSMGGIVGMLLAAAEPSPIRRLVLNDIGAQVPEAGMAPILEYVGLDPSFRDLDELEAYLRRIHATFGPLDDAMWRHLAVHGARRRPDGSLGLAYDPRIAEPFRAQAEADISLWEVYDAIRCPVLLLRGAESTLLPREVAHAMRERGPRAEVVEIEGVGHAPALSSPDQIAIVRAWLGL